MNGRSEQLPEDRQQISTRSRPKVNNHAVPDVVRWPAVSRPAWSSDCVSNFRLPVDSVTHAAIARVTLQHIRRAERAQSLPASLAETSPATQSSANPSSLSRQAVDHGWSLPAGLVPAALLWRVLRDTVRITIGQVAEPYGCRDASC